MNHTSKTSCHAIVPKDESAIMKLLAQYGPVFDHGKAEAYARLFTHGGQLSFPDETGNITVIRGREALATFAEKTYQSSLATGTRGVHFAGKSILVQVNHDTVHAYTPVTLILTPANARSDAEIMAVGQYADVIKKIQGEWLFESRAADSYAAGQLPADFLPTMT